MRDSTEASTRSTSPALDAILGKTFNVLDDGFFRVVDYMGSDQAIVQAARTSYGKGTKKILEDQGLIRYLIRNRHTTPLEMCEIKLHVRVPMDAWRQWIRHRTASVNEYSTRYSLAIDSAAKTLPGEWRTQAISNKQGSTEGLSLEVGEDLTRGEEKFHTKARRLYETRIRKGVAREQARKDLPLSTYTEAYWKIDLHNLMHFLQLRMDGHAQKEIREYAHRIGHEVVSLWCPIAWQAFLDYRINAMTLSSIDIRVVHALSTGGPDAACHVMREAGLLPPEGEPLKRSRERGELREKFERLGLSLPWQHLIP